jgi:UDP-2,3-diacylglucosamine pyrophosphatase LpxH
VKCFISDLHLGDQFIDFCLLQKFLNEIRSNNHELILVGDIFDFWRYPRLSEFSKIFEGIKTQILLGNHDFPLEFSKMFGGKVFKTYESFGKTYSLIATHGDEFDSIFSYPGNFSRMMDCLLYGISTKIRYNLRNLIRWMSFQAYEYMGYTFQAYNKYCIDYDLAIVGHSHFGGVKGFGKFRVFNLGSWYGDPWAFFLREDEKYAFFKITESNLLPQAEDFNSFR